MGLCVCTPLAILWASPAATPFHFSDTSYRITRETLNSQFPINSPVTKFIIQATRHSRSFIKSHRIWPDKGFASACP